jgi:NADH-quinone oxidoreductase subunit N
MIAYVRTRPTALEAAVKYLVLASTSSAFLIFGLALLYAATGSLEVGQWVAAPRGGMEYFSSSLLALGSVLVIVGAGFKLAAFPFHMWTPDVYQASSEPVAAFIATASKGAMVAFLLRFAISTDGFVAGSALATVVTVVAVLSMLAGNLLALLQNDIRRLLAYSSIAHMGYLLVAIIVASAAADSGATATGYYLAAYFPAMLAAFAVLSTLKLTGRDVTTTDDLRGLARERPFAALVMTLAFLSLAGLPLTSGFMAKLYVVTSGVAVNAWPLIIALVIGTSIGIFYYLRVISAMCASRTAEIITLPTSSGCSVRMVAVALLVVLAVLIIWLGIQPLPLLRLLASSSNFGLQAAASF